MKIAHGVFGWDGTERRSNRYGAIHLADEPYEGPAATKTTFDREALRALAGKRVRITAKVLEARKSGHVGDSFLKIYPSIPEVGEEIDLGVGILDTEPGYDGTPDIILKPADGRGEFWMDPNKLYRLHDQTVDIHAEETADECSPKPNVKSDGDGAIDHGDGSYQVKTKHEGANRILPKIERLGDGLFALTPVGGGPPGERYALEHDPNYRRTRFGRM